MRSSRMSTSTAMTSWLRGEPPMVRNWACMQANSELHRTTSPNKPAPCSHEGENYREPTFPPRDEGIHKRITPAHTMCM